MFYNLYGAAAEKPMIYAALLAGFVLTYVLLRVFKSKLPGDIGRAFAVNAAAAKGKPRGAGVVFVPVFALLVLLFAPLTWENICYAVLMILAMLAGYLDDASKNPWGEYKKGIIDLVISLAITLVFILNNTTDIVFAYFGKTVTLPFWLYAILGTVLVWASINVVNCTDGVDGLSSTLSLLSMGAFIVLFNKSTVAQHIECCMPGIDFKVYLYGFMGVIGAYLLLNAGPSIMLMGDAGSRTLGVFFALAAMKSGAPLMFIPICLVFIIDGGLGLIKVSLLRFLKIHILKNVRTPIHDHVRKNKNWSDAQTVIRFAVLHGVVLFAALFLIK